MSIFKKLFKKRPSNCPCCGAALEKKSMFCVHCGYNLETGEKLNLDIPDPIRVWFVCPKCGARWEKSGDTKHLPEFGRCYNCGYEEKE